MTTAVIYASKFGATKAAAEHIAKSIGADCLNLKKDSIDLSKYDRIIIGTGIYAGKPAKAVSEFIETNKDAMSTASLFVSCMYNDDKGDKQLENVANSLGIADAIYFNKVKAQIGVKGSKLEEYIRSL